MAYVAGRSVRVGDLLPSLLEQVGGTTLTDTVLGLMLARRLDANNLTVTASMIEAERQLLLDTLADDEDEASRLLTELRRRRGLGETRFADLLWRNAGLRVLVADGVQVTASAKRREYRLVHGPAARVRLLMTERLGEAQRLRRRAVTATSGAGFGELAALHSVDESAAQGGLLPWVRSDDTSFPETLRSAIEGLEPGEVSEVITLDGGFGLLWLERRRTGDGTDYAAVEADLGRAVRLRAERVLMQQLAGELVRSADVVILDPALKTQWERQREVFGELR